MTIFSYLTESKISVVGDKLDNDEPVAMVDDFVVDSFISMKGLFVVCLLSSFSTLKLNIRLAQSRMSKLAREDLEQKID